MPSRSDGRESVLEMKYFAAYYLANVLHGVIVDPTPYLRHIDAFCGDAATASFYAPFPRYSALHRWAEFVWHDILGEDINDLNVDALAHNPHSSLWVEDAMRSHGQVFTPIREWWRASGRVLDDLDEDAIADYYAFLMDEGSLDEVSTQVAREVFQILFLNRRFLRGFNQLIAGEVRRAREGTVVTRRARSWALPRARLPIWAQRAVFYRDRGRCVFCRRDLTGLINFPSAINFDHIVPLAHGGINDVSNLQLLCEGCNAKKGARHDRTVDQYDEWFRPLAG